MKKVEIGIFAEGGGAGSAYIHGVLKGLNIISNRFSLDNVKFYVASSGAAPTVFNHPLNTLDTVGFEVWKAIGDKKFISKYRIDRLFFGKPYLNVDYLINHIFKEVYKVSLKQINSIKTEIFIPVLNLETLNIELFSNSKKTSIEYNGRKIVCRDWREYNIYDVVKATQALPILYNKSIKIGSSRYVDGGLTDELLFDIKGYENVKKIYILMSSDKDFKKKYDIRLGFIYLISRYFKYFRNLGNPKLYDLLLDKTLYKRDEKIKELLDLQSNNKILIIRPSKSINSFNNNFKGVQRNIELGINDVVQNKKNIIRYLEK